MTELASLALIALSLLTAGAFWFYGFETLYAVPPRGDYERYGFPHMRVFVGRAQLLGAAGVILGLAVPAIGVAASSGLLLMMLWGLAVRYRLHDAPRLMMPAATLAVMNATIIALHTGALG